MFNRFSLSILTPTSALAFTLASGIAQAAYLPIDTFESLSLGNVNGQNGWVDSGNIGEVVLDPAGGDNQVLAVSTKSGTLNRAAVIPAGVTGTLFLRFRFEEHGRYSFGMSHFANPSQYSDFGPELGMASATSANPNNELRAANGSTLGSYDDLELLSPNNWYNIWIEVNNDSDSYRVWLNDTPGGSADPLNDLLDNDAGVTTFDFRSTSTNDLLNFFIKTGGGSSEVQGTFYLDDIYLDLNPQNLSNPVPVPAAVWLFGSGLLGLIGVARRKKTP